ncbi:adenine phosphoribosyl transferase, Phosphoribosyltransferase-like protein [Artemisia annua]|uniref:adenine phosphoribosyltransferase n=1 Tax=Artemisia annua TaxID=35608 RepID=A0A2U1MG32_ARTAN|nr:adenine phosphoribosyl transferase, Phosphoribosyltransferase-like protein [Artemisia annua]
MAAGDHDSRISGIKSALRVIPHFPKPGIMFQDITTLLLDPKAFKDTIDLFVERYKHENISVIAGIEARGFIFGPPIALAIGAKFVPLRKPKKLPERAGAEVVECACVIEVPDLKGRERLRSHGKPLYVLVESQLEPTLS